MQACKLRRINARSSCPEAPVSKEFSEKLMAMRAEREKQDTMWTSHECQTLSPSSGEQQKAAPHTSSDQLAIASRR